MSAITVQGNGDRRGILLKKLAAVFAAASLVMATGVNTAALASTYDKTYSSQVLLNGKVAAKPYILVHGSTKYVPVWYVAQVLKSKGIKSTWNGYSWRLATPSGIKPDLSNVHAGTGSTAIYVNGKLVLRANGIVHKDPASKQATTYLPVASVEQLFKRLQFDSSWDGMKWNIFSRDLELQILANADKESSAATYHQAADHLKTDITLNLTKLGKEDFQGVKFPWTMEEQVNEQFGTVDGEKAFTATVSVVRDTITDVPPYTVQFYGQGSHVYVKDGNTWTELSQDEAKQLNTMDFSYKSLTHVQPKVLKNGFQYSAGLDSKTTVSLLDYVLTPLLDVNVTKLNSAQRQLLLKNTSVLMQLQVTPTGGKYYISNMKLRLQTKVPPSIAFPGNDPDSVQMRKDVTSVTVVTDVAAKYTYNKVEISKPSDLTQN
jgi:hypothetical protein